jgi:methionyl-tRNA formyltransferase
MKTVLLTTDTIHHRFFASRVQEMYPFSAIFVEKTGSHSPVSHPLDRGQNHYEEETLLPSCTRSFSELAVTYEWDTVNGDGTLTALLEISPEIILIIGTGKISDAVIRSASLVCLNLHGGNPEEYRGLDTLLWAIYHKDFQNLVTTLHMVDSTLDTGDIVFQARIPVEKTTEISHIRSLNTGVCISMVLLALHSLERSGWIPSREQVRKGRYYSSIPEELKDTCIRNFQGYVNAL